MLDRSPRADLQRLREARSRELRAVTEALDARQACLARLATIDADIEGYESEERSRNRNRRLAAQKRAHAFYRDGTPRDQPGHREIVRRYSWTQKPRNAPLRRGSRSLVALLRLRELERLWAIRYGGVLPDDDAGLDDLWIAAQLICHRQGDITAKVVAWARVWAPWCSAQEAAALAAHVVSHPYKFSADTLAEKVGLTYGERQALGITTIGATDVDPAERERLRRQRSRANEKQKRRAAGVVPREVYEEASNESLRPWEDEGISRATWYRRRRASRVVEGFRGFDDGQKGEGEGFSTVSGAGRGSLEAGGGLRAELGGETAENRAGEPRETSLRSAGYEVASAGQTPVSSGVSATVVPGADDRSGDPFAPPRPHSLRRTTARAPVERRGLSFPPKVALSVPIERQLSSEAGNCCICAEPFFRRLKQLDDFCDDDCRQIGRLNRKRVFRTEGPC